MERVISYRHKLLIKAKLSVPAKLWLDLGWLSNQYFKHWLLMSWHLVVLAHQRWCLERVISETINSHWYCEILALFKKLTSLVICIYVCMAVILVSISTLIQVLSWCLMAPSHYLNQCWFISKNLSYTSQTFSVKKNPFVFSHKHLC